VVLNQFRTLFEQSKDSSQRARFSRDLENAMTFMRSQRVYKARPRHLAS
jgi:hypothetical protein